MKLYIFGSCSGTEPMPQRHHTALALEIGGRVYWFDAGENCSHTAFTMGVDLLSVSDIFISHTHMDHIGGLGNLLWNIRNYSCNTKQLPRFGGVTVYIPNLETYEGILTVLKNAGGNYRTEYETPVKQITDSTLLKNSDIEVVAVHNHHLPQKEDAWQSFSFAITTENKRIIYSGDVKTLEDLAPLLSQGCDLLLMETGHHKPDEVCQTILDRGYGVKSIYFLHHGRIILKDYDGALDRCQKIFPSVKFCNDADVFEL